MGGLLLGGLLLFLRRLCSCCRGRKAIGVCLFFPFGPFFVGAAAWFLASTPQFFHCAFLAVVLALFTFASTNLLMYSMECVGGLTRSRRFMTIFGSFFVGDDAWFLASAPQFFCCALLAAVLLLFHLCIN